MFRWIFFAQAVIYLLIMPVLRRSLEFGYHPSLGSGLLAIASLIAGYVLYGIRNKNAATSSESFSMPAIYPKGFLVYAIPVAAILYATTVLSYGLLSRRQGSEFMAELYSQLPIYALIIIRFYEILLIPFILLYLFPARIPLFHKRIAFSAIILSLPFTGIMDSRSKLLIIVLYVACFIKVDNFKNAFLKYARLYFVGLIAAGAFVFYSAQRLSGYSSFNDFLLVEVYQRLDGLSLVTDLRDSGALDRTGQFNFAMFDPLLSRIPFLEAARVAKSMGRTSSKQYYLQEVLGRNQLDAPNSMIADPLYFAGWAGVIVAFIVLGYLIAIHDGFIKAGKLFRGSKNRTAIAIAFVTSFVLIENDLVGAPLSFLQNYIVVSLFLMLGTTHRPQST